MVTERQQDILNLIIDIFTKTHEPVGSKKPCKSLLTLAVQPFVADMAELENKGCLRRPGYFGGRMPSKKFSVL